MLVGTTPRLLDVDQVRRTARHLDSDVLIGVQGSRLVLVIGRADDPKPPAGEGAEAAPAARRAAGSPPSSTSPRGLEPAFGPGPVVLGDTVPDLVAASRSARAALAGFAAARAVRAAPRAHGGGRPAARARPRRRPARAQPTLVTRIHAPLKEHHSPELLVTLWAYLDNGRSLEGTARELFVHPNTVRYRLKRITELLGWDPTSPRDAFVLHQALILGAISEPVQARRRR